LLPIAGRSGCSALRWRGNGKKPMTHQSTVILGVPIDNVELDETVTRIFEMADACDRDGRPRLAVTVQADMLMNLRFRSRDPDYPVNTVNILGQADLLIPVGAPVSMAARILGQPLRQSFSGTALFGKLFKKAEAERKSVYFFGGKTSMIRHAADSIREAFPGLTVAGTHTVESGRGIAELMEEAVSQAVERINSSGADLLFIDLNDPAAAGWFEKNRFRLYVPLILVISGVRDLVRACGKSVPGLRRPTLRGNIAFTLILLPLVLYQKYRQLVFTLFHNPSMLTAIRNSVSKSGGMAVKSITMPDPLDATITEDIRAGIKQMAGKAPKIVLDFSRVNFIDSSGLGLLLSLWRTARIENREIFIIGVKPAIHRFFKLSRTLDFFGNRICENLDDVLTFIRTRATYSNFYYLAVIRNRAVVYHFFGELDASEILDLDIRALMDPIGARDVIFNLTGLTFIDSAGIRLFIRMHRHVSSQGRNCILCGLQENVSRIFRIVRLDQLFISADNIFAAELALRRLHLQRNTTGRENLETESRGGANG